MAETEIPDLTPQNDTLEDSLPYAISQNISTSVTMQHMPPSDSIEETSLSARSRNALRRAGIHTVEAMLSLDRDQMSSFRNLGAKSIDEIEQLQNEIKSGLYGFVEANYFDTANIAQMAKTDVFYDASGILRYDIPIDNLKLPHRANRILMEAGYSYSSKLLGVTADELLALPNMGIGSVNNILEKIPLLDFVEVKKCDNEISQAEKDCMGFVSRFIKHIPAHAGQLFTEIYPIFRDAHNNDVVFDIGALFEISVLHKLTTNKILTILSNSLFGVERDRLLSLFPDDIIPVGVITTILDELWGENKIRLGEMVEMRRPTLREYVNSIDDEKERGILSLRLQGKTLEEIAIINGGLTRERIRQIIKKCIKHKNKMQIMLEEDKYSGIFALYSFSKDDFISAFDIDDSVYIYLTLVCNRNGAVPIENFLEDMEYSAELRKRAECVIYKDYFTINGVRILKQRAMLADYIVRNYFQEEATMDEFEVMYNNVLHELGEQSNEKFTLNRETYRNRLADSDNVLWKYPNKLRYYDMRSRDFSTLHYENDLLDSCYLYTLDEKFTEGVRQSLGQNALDGLRLTLKSAHRSFSIISEYKTDVPFPRDAKRALSVIKKYFEKAYKTDGKTLENKTRLEAYGYTFSSEIIEHTKSGSVNVLTRETLKDLNTVNIRASLDTHKHGRDFHHCAAEIGLKISLDYDSIRTILQRLFTKAKGDSTRILSLEWHNFYAFVINNRSKLKDDIAAAMADETLQMELALKNTTEKPIGFPQVMMFLYDAGAKEQAVMNKNVYHGYLSSAEVRSTSERLFEQYCETSNRIKWVYKNGDKGLEFFSIVYEDNFGKQKSFYPDYIIEDIDGGIWIIETKGGFSRSGQSEDIDAYTAKKFNDLQRYLKAYNKLGGIVRQDKQSQKLCICTDDYSDDIRSDGWRLLSDVL